MRRVKTALFFVFLSLFTVAASVSPTPLEVVKKNIDEVINALTSKKLSLKEKKEKIKTAIEETIYWDEVSKRVLGIYYRKISRKEFEKFRDLFREFIKNIYAKKFLRYSGEKIVYKGQRIEGDYAIVNMDLITTKGQKVPVDCRLVRRNGKWLVYDVLIEGISMVNNYRIQINRVIAKRGFKGLVKLLERKVKKYRESS